MTLLDDEPLIARIRALRKQGKTQEEIAAEIGVTQGTVSRILRREGLGGHRLAPTLAEQIKAIEATRKLVVDICDGRIDPPDEIDAALDGLAAALETLRSLDFAQEALK